MRRDRIAIHVVGRAANALILGLGDDVCFSRAVRPLFTGTAATDNVSRENAIAFGVRHLTDVVTLEHLDLIRTCECRKGCARVNLAWGRDRLDPGGSTDVSSNIIGSPRDGIHTRISGAGMQPNPQTQIMRKFFCDPICTAHDLREAQRKFSCLPYALENEI